MSADDPGNRAVAATGPLDPAKIAAVIGAALRLTADEQRYVARALRLNARLFAPNVRTLSDGSERSSDEQRCTKSVTPEETKA